VPSATRADAPSSWFITRADLADGTVLRDVTVSWADDGAKLHLTRTDGGWKDIAPARLLRALDADGHDRRDEILAGRPGGGAAPSSGASGLYNEVGAASTASERTNLVTAGGPALRSVFSVSPGWGTGGGDWMRGVDSGFSLQGTVRVGVGHRSWLTLLARNQDASRSGSGSLREFGVLMGGCYTGGRMPRPTGTWDVGMSAVTMGAARTAVMIVAQLGALIPLGNHFVFDFQVHGGVRPTFIFDDREPGGSIFTVHAGIGVVNW